MSPHANMFASIHGDSGSTKELRLIKNINTVDADFNQFQILYQRTCSMYCLRSLVWSPDSKKIAVWESNGLIADNSLVIIDVLTGIYTRYTYQGLPDTTIWSRDGNSILFDSDHNVTSAPLMGGERNPTLVSFSLATQTFTTLPIARPLSLSAWQPSISMNGKDVYRFWSSDNKHNFYTASYAEARLVAITYPNSTWSYENVAYFYTTSQSEKQYVIDKYSDYTWRYEGVAYYVYP